MSQSSPPPLPQRPQRGELAKFIAGFGYAFSGLWYALRTQRNARVHLILALLAILLGIALHISAIEFAMIFVAITAVFIAEMVNTAVELCIDLASPGYHPLAKIAKDVAAGAVLLSAILAVVIALFIFVPHLWPLIILFFHHGLAARVGAPLTGPQRGLIASLLHDGLAARVGAPLTSPQRGLIASLLHDGLAAVPVLGKQVEENALLWVLLNH
ncbi:MAG TPA: diacylglycerol kinase family protein [Ktedonobacteraceae bacterium]|nr:diacylglycerol kinase family protein [Ktedonobacteraceae bacterium]